jgi:hypothetical protein
MESILIVHPEGNIANNPGLTSIVLALNKQYRICIIQREIKFDCLEVDWPNVNIFFFRDIENNNKFSEYIRNDLFNVKYALSIGVDQGIKFADFVSRTRNIPLGFISYEIYFANEWEPALKQQEVEACRNIQFAISQDSMRSFLLSEENKIPVAKIINVPISGKCDESYLYPESNRLKSVLSIPEDKKIALYMGSLGDWTVSNKLFHSVVSWPDNWVLVVHPRYGADSLDTSILESIGKNEKVFLSRQPIRYTYDLGGMVSSADIGIVLYDFDTFQPYTGKNILFAGLSSGKFSMYLKHRVPILANNNTNLADIVYKYQLGYVAQNIEDINPKYFDADNLNVWRKNGHSFFKNYLDFSLYEQSLLRLIEDSIARRDVTDIILDNNKKIDLHTIESSRLNITYNKMREELNAARLKLETLDKRRFWRIISRIYRYLIKIVRKIQHPPPQYQKRKTIIADNYRVLPKRLNVPVEWRVSKAV